MRLFQSRWCCKLFYNTFYISCHLQFCRFHFIVFNSHLFRLISKAGSKISKICANFPNHFLQIISRMYACTKFWIYEWENTHSLNPSPNSVAVQKCRYLADNLLSFSFILNLNAFFMMSPGDVPLSPFASFPFEVLYIWISRFTAPPRHVHRQLPISIYNLFLSTFSTKHNKTEGGEPRCWRGGEHSHEHCPWTSPHLHPPVL